MGLVSIMHSAALLGKKIAVTASLSFVFASSAHAAPVVFDFEELAEGAYASVVMNRPGYAVTVSRTSGITFEIVDISSSSPPAGWASRTLSPFNNFSTNDGFLFDMSVPVQSVSIETADYFADSDIVSLTAYDSLGGTGNILDAVTVNWGTQGPPAVALLKTLSPSILSVVARGGSAEFPASVYWDNLTIYPAPASVPGPLPLLGVGAAFGYSRKLRKRIKTSKK